MAKFRSVFVAKDNGAASTVTPVALAAIAAGHEVFLVAEGLAIKRAREANLPIYGEGTENFLEVPFLADPLKVLKDLHPDVLVIGQSEPGNLEIHFAQAASLLDIAVVSLGDSWKGWVRNPVRPTLLGVLDQVDAVLAHERFGDGTKVFVSGNPGAKDVAVPGPLTHLLNDLRKKFGKLIVYIGGSHVQTGPELELLIGCVKKTPNCGLIWRPHPKYEKVKRVSGETWFEHWRTLVASLGERVISITPPAPSSNPFISVNDQIACGSDLVVSGFSTVSTTAEWAGVRALMLETDATMRDLKESSGLDQIPLVTLGVAPSIKIPMDLTRLIYAPRPSLDDVRKKLKPYNPTLVLSEIEALIASRK